MTEPQRIDFEKLIADLVAGGLSIYKISVMVGEQYHTVSRWSRGAEPRHHKGQLLLAIHAEYVTLAQTK